MTLVDWAEINDPNWQPSFAQSRAGLVTTFSGECPRCEDQMTFDVALAIPSARDSTTRDSPEPFTMLCSCGRPHPGHPEGDYSCGAYWPYEAKLGS
jgi:hypothetical protein